VFLSSPGLPNTPLIDAQEYGMKNNITLSHLNRGCASGRTQRIKVISPLDIGRPTRPIMAMSSCLEIAHPLVRRPSYTAKLVRRM
jgi:hypothetical protein